MRRRVDFWLVFAVLLGIVLRVVPVYRWGFGALVRDEAQYANLGRNIVAGNGLISPQDWLWAPAYPYLIALFQTLMEGTAVTRTLPYFQCLVGGLTCIVVYAITLRVFENRKAAVLAALMYAVHPTLIYFSGRLWCEAIYGPVLLSMVLSTLWARDGRAARAWVPGLLLGLCVLLRGVATYIPPLVVLALLWPDPDKGYRDALRRRYRHALMMGVALLVAVAPYSMHASAKHGGLIVSDATVGNLMYLGNNDFTPITFDYGNGVFKQIARGASTRHGRKHCKASTPAEWNQCEVDKGVEWILDNPGTFLSRMPMRTAQLVNPHSFLTRALRWGKYDGVPWWLKELLILAIAGTTFAILLGGTVGVCARGRGPYAWLAVGIVAYTVAASAALYGLTRFRIPIEPLWMIYLAGLLAEPKVAWEALRSNRVRIGLVVIWTPLLLLHMLWFFPTAWPGFTW
jgi:hypothetical protein